MRVLIVGCGYVGLPLARSLVAQGHQVTGVRRRPEGAAELREAGVEPCIGDVASPEFRLPEERFDWVVFAASSGRDSGLEGYQRVYLEGTRRLVELLKGAPPKKYVYTGSTSVYAQLDGSLVKEHSPTEPEAPTAKVLLETERVLLEAAKGGFPSVILRVAGIYGPGRGHPFHQYLRNEARIHGQGLRLMNMIHRDDVVGGIVAALKGGRTGEIYNLVDQEPVTEIHFYTWMSETLGKYLPPTVPEESDPNRKRAVTHKKVSNRRLTMELGYTLKYPTFRQGYTAEIKSLTDAGLLEIEPEPR